MGFSWLYQTLMHNSFATSDTIQSDRGNTALDDMSHTSGARTKNSVNDHPTDGVPQFWKPAEFHEDERRNICFLVPHCGIHAPCRSVVEGFNYLTHWCCLPRSCFFSFHNRISPGYPDTNVAKSGGAAAGWSRDAWCHSWIPQILVNGHRLDASRGRAVMGCVKLLHCCRKNWWQMPFGAMKKLGDGRRKTPAVQLWRLPLQNSHPSDYCSIMCYTLLGFNLS